MVSSSFQIAEKLDLLLTERESLFATWEDHKTELDQAYDLHVFLRDAKQIDTFTSTQEVIYNNYSPKRRWLVVTTMVLKLNKVFFAFMVPKTLLHNTRYFGYPN